MLTRDDLADRGRYLNARSTLRTLLDLGVVPVVNENDTVATDELRFGDNDTLAALVANLIEADLLILLTDQEGLFDADRLEPRMGRFLDGGGWSSETYFAAMPEKQLERPVSRRIPVILIRGARSSLRHQTEWRWRESGASWPPRSIPGCAGKGQGIHRSSASR